ncbi:hypothetical protein TNCT_295421 [Trichonephila clavata]|uniref:Uncharacterized protein n=1 Tax=Trichonephila clavata TaxID=2740835 RepID=A0A8X6J704_TRICU|nr:hypothetical protein TNCT_295421 [Trichonephila clavata]
MDAMGAIYLCQCVTKEVHVVPQDVCAGPHANGGSQPQREGHQDTLISQSQNTLTMTQLLFSADTEE